MRALLLAALLAVPPAQAAGHPAEIWTLTFTATSVRAVGKHVPRGDESCGFDSCEASYQFVKHGADGQSTTFTMSFDPSGCTAPPCDMPSQTKGGGWRGTVHWDGTAYTATGSFQSWNYCDRHFTSPADVVHATVHDGTVTGDASIVLGYVAPTDGKHCLRVAGYEVYTGTISGRRIAAPGVDRESGSGTNAAPLPAAARKTVVADRVAAARHSRSVLSTAVADAREVPWSPVHLAVSALLALLLVALLPFPAALFNGTLERNYETVRGWFAFVPRRSRERSGRPWLGFVAVVAASALLNAFLDPRLRLDAASAQLVGGLALSIAAVALLASVPARTYARRTFGESLLFQALPLGLVVAAVCVLVSRLTGFQPGYLYGVVAGYAFRRELAPDESGRIAFRTAAFLLLVAAVAFAVRIPVHTAAAHGGVALGLLDTVLAAVFAAGIEGNLLGLLPLRFLPGEAVFGWNRGAWAVAFGLSAFAFLHALSARAGDASTAVSVTVAAVLFVAFGAVSVAFWAWFRFHPTPASV